MERLMTQYNFLPFSLAIISNIRRDNGDSDPSMIFTLHRMNWFEPALGAH